MQFRTLAQGFSSSKNPFEALKAIGAMYGKNYEWKISDIDDYLKGNDWQ